MMTLRNNFVHPFVNQTLIFTIFIFSFSVFFFKKINNTRCYKPSTNFFRSSFIWAICLNFSAGFRTISICFCCNKKERRFFSTMGQIRYFITCSKSISILTLTENVEYFTSMLINVNILLRKALHVITYKRQYIQLVRPRWKLLCIN